MNKEIRIKPNKGKPKILERTAAIPKALIRKTGGKGSQNLSREHEVNESSPTHYAENKMEESAKNSAHTINNATHNTIKGVKFKIKERIEKSKAILNEETNSTKKNLKSSQKVGNEPNEIKGNQQPNVKNGNNNFQTRKADNSKITKRKNNTFNRKPNTLLNCTTEGSKEIPKTVDRGTIKTKKTVHKTIKSTAKTVKKTSKTAVKASKTAVKTAARTAKTAAKATRDAAKGLQAAARAARLAAKATKTAIKILQAIIKAVIKAVQALIQIIAAGGWVALLVILIIVVVIVLIVFLLGIFFAEDSGGLSIKDTIVETNAAFELAIETQIDNFASGGNYDKVNVVYDGNMDGDSDTVNNWRDILIVFSAQRMGLGESAIELTEESKAELIHLFYSMNEVSYRTEVVTQTIEENESYSDIAPSDNDNDETRNEEATETITVLNIIITIDSKSWEEEAVILMFDKSQMQIAEELAKPEYYSMFADLIGEGLFDKESIGDLKNIISGLPKGQSGSAAVELALSRLGDPYSQPKRGQGNNVDCSYLVWWAYNQLGINLPGTSVEQAQYCINNGWSVGQSELQPGDLVFWSKTTCGCGRWNEIHHVGMYIGDNKVVEASSSKGAVVVSELWGLNGGKWQVYAYARPL